MLCCHILVFGQLDFKQVQNKLDKAHSGIGLSFTRVNLGKRIKSDQNWIGFNMYTDALEAKLDFGRVLLSEPDPFSSIGESLGEPIFYNRYTTGFNFYIGGNFAISQLGLGSQNSFWKVKRFHPNFTIGMGSFNFRQENQWNIKDGFHYIGAGFSARIRLPLISVEPFINWNIGIQTGDNFDAFRYHCINTGLIFRLDGLKQLLNPSLISVNATTVSVKNIESNSYTTTSYDVVNGSRVKTTTKHTTTTANYNVSESKVGIQAIDPLAGFTLRFGMNSIKTGTYIPRGFFGGIGFHGRNGPGYIGVNIDYGRIGHGSRMQELDKKTNKKVDRKVRTSMGSFNSFMMIADIGYDVSPMILGLLGTVREDDGSNTSFASMILGYSFGFHTVGKQAYDEIFGAGAITNYLNNNPDLERSYQTDPAMSKGGYLGGFFFAVEIGVVELRVQGLRFAKAPLANNRYFSLSYSIPIN